MYVVLETFRDRMLGIVCKKDTVYPPEGKEVPGDWIERLLTGDNACKRPFLRAVQPMLEEAPSPEMGVLKAEADALGVQYSHRIGLDTLRDRVAQAKAERA